MDNKDNQFEEFFNWAKKIDKTRFRREISIYIILFVLFTLFFLIATNKMGAQRGEIVKNSKLIDSLKSRTQSLTIENKEFRMPRLKYKTQDSLNTEKIKKYKQDSIWLVNKVSKINTILPKMYFEIDSLSSILQQCQKLIPSKSNGSIWFDSFFYSNKIIDLNKANPDLLILKNVSGKKENITFNIVEPFKTDFGAFTYLPGNLNCIQGGRQLEKNQMVVINLKQLKTIGSKIVIELEYPSLIESDFYPTITLLLNTK